MDTLKTRLNKGISVQAASSKLRAFLETNVAPIAGLCDTSFSTLNQIFQLLGKEGLYALFIQSEIAKQPLSASARFDNKAIETQYSGALSFLTSQINLSSSLIYYGNNEDLKSTLLPKVFRGELRIGNAVSHLRSPEFIVNVKKHNNGFLLNGSVRWLTGSGHFSHFILGFRDETYEYFALLPFENNEHLQFSSPLEVVTMQATQTVNLSLTNYFVAKEDIVKFQENGSWYQEMVKSPHLLPYFYGIGVAALTLAKNRYQKQSALLLRLEEELNALREQIISQENNDYIQLRIKLTQCAWQCLQCAVTVAKGEALNPKSEISRLYREIVQYNALANIPEFIERSLVIS